MVRLRLTVEMGRDGSRPLLTGQLHTRRRVPAAPPRRCCRRPRRRQSSLPRKASTGHPSPQCRPGRAGTGDGPAVGQPPRPGNRAVGRASAASAANGPASASSQPCRVARPEVDSAVPDSTAAGSAFTVAASTASCSRRSAQSRRRRADDHQRQHRQHRTPDGLRPSTGPGTSWRYCSGGDAAPTSGETGGSPGPGSSVSRQIHGAQTRSWPARPIQTRRRLEWWRPVVVVASRRRRGCRHVDIAGIGAGDGAGLNAGEEDHRPGGVP